MAGRSHECDYPESITNLPVLTSSKISISDKDNADIHQSVMQLLRNALSIYEVDEKKLIEISPDIILTQDHCEVCAVSSSDLTDSVRKALGKSAEIISTSPVNLETVFESFEHIARKLGCSQKGIELVRNIQGRFDEIHGKIKHKPKPDVVALEWIDPLMSGGNWMPEMIEIAGGRSHLAQAGKHSPTISWKQILKTDPDILLMVPCGYSIKKTFKEMNTLTQIKSWGSLSAVQKNQVYILDGNHYFNRPGPRIKESVEILARIFHPSIFKYVTTDTGWVRFHKKG